MISQLEEPATEMATVNDADRGIAAPEPTTPPRIWGLSAGHFHGAYWRARGVQCVRRGRRQPWQPGVELFLLVEPDQLVMFDLAELSDRLTWHHAVITRVRLIDQDDEEYSEQVIADDDGFVQRIERRYRPRFQGSTRVIITRSRRVAKLWMAARNRREGWDRVRRSVPWAKVDHFKCRGRSFSAGNAQQDRLFLDEVIEAWPDPGRSISGIVEIEPRVWGHEALPQDSQSRTVRIGPVWLGFGSEDERRTCLIGPAWIADRPGRTPRSDDAPAIREIDQVELAERTRQERQSPSGPGVTYAVAKRLTDLVFSATALLCLSPIMLVVAAMILMQDGWPIFFGHRRQGKDGKPFRCWKFRTMHRNAEQMARQLEEYNVCDGPQVFIQDDPRVTRIGRFLRDKHMDEVPQFFNVLLGQMSVVGPRPSPADENQYCPAWRDVRLSVRPGITGLWQLNRTREKGEDFQEWIRYDIEYVNRASYWFDLRIMIATAWAILFGRSERGPD